MKRVALLCLALTAVLAAPAGAATYEVNTTADTTVAGGCDTNPQCSIRDALNLANAGSGHTVSVRSGTYELGLGELNMGSDTRLVGAGARTTIIDANGDSRVISAQGTNYIEGVTVTGGRATFFAMGPIQLDAGYGGGILSSGSNDPLTLVNSTVTGNSAEFGGGGVATASIHGGDAGPLIITGSTISANKVEGGAGSGRGGGVASFDTLTITNSTITGNSVDNTGFVNQGGGVSAASAGAILRNVTIASNISAGGVDAGAGFAGDDLGVPPLDSALTATNTIIAGNTHAGAPSDCGFVDLQATDNNISSDDSCNFDDPGSKEDTDPQLGALANNAGQTDTRKFAVGAPPHNAGVAANCPGTDQRGVTRPQGGTCDIGAVELAPPTAVTGGVSGLIDAAATILGTSTNPFIVAGTASFEYGTTTAYGASVPSGGTVSLSLAGTPGVPARVSEAEDAALIGLTPGTQYHYRLVVRNDDGISHGADATFTTPTSITSLPPVRLRPTLSAGGVPRSCVRRAFNLRVRARVSSGTRLKAVRVTLDGRTIKRTTRGTFTVRVNAARLSSGRHTLRIKAVDRGNRTRTVTRRFTRCARAVPQAQPRFTG